MAATQAGKKPVRQSWMNPGPSVAGIASLRAELFGESHCRHRHDTYTISLTDWGVQEFSYRGAVHRSQAGQVVILHPDEAHDGRPGDGCAFAYRSLYVEPAAVHEAVKELAGATAALPFVADPLAVDSAGWRRICSCFDADIEPLGADCMIVLIAQALLAASGSRRLRSDSRLSARALDAAAEFLRAHACEAVDSRAVEAHCGLSRCELNVQFRRRYGTTPYRYLLLRRLEVARAHLLQGASAAQAAADTGFADQSHMTRAWRRAYGFPPGRLLRLQRAA